MTDLVQGFAFFEYVDSTVTDLATQGLNGMELGDRYLVVQRASIGAKGISSTPGMPTVEEYNTGMGAGIIPKPIMPALVDPSNGANSRILLMLNMVTPEDLVDDTEYEEILEDIRAECGNYGQVESVLVPRPGKKEKTGWVPGSANAEREQADQQAEGVGRVYVRYVDAAGAGSAMRALAGRSFAGRSIIATLLGDEANSLFEQVATMD
jgi:splicing factor U2AF subunit